MRKLAIFVVKWIKDVSVHQVSTLILGDRGGILRTIVKCRYSRKPTFMSSVLQEEADEWPERGGKREREREREREIG